MKQYEAVIKVMEENGGFSTLGYLYQKVLKVPNCEWKTKTPYASIRRIVQDKRFFFKIRPGLWALKSYKNTVLDKFNLYFKLKANEEIFSHTYYQGLLVEIGNIKGYETFVPNQDKNKKFLNKPLKEITKIDKIYEFSYPEIVKKAKTIDVIWFNNKKLPYSFFEVEHTIEIQKALLKFLYLKDFYSNFNVVSSIERKKEFEEKINNDVFNEINSRVKFLDYNYISDLHTKSFELYELQKNNIVL